MQWSYAVLLFFLVVIDRRIANAQLNIDSPCTVKNQTGYCELLQLCPPVEKDLANRIRPEFICGYQELVPIVCCPYRISKDGQREKWENNNNGHIKPDLNKRPAERMCKKYEMDAINEELGELLSGGSVANNTEFPHMAAIGFVKNNTIRWNCGGTLISDQWVLSASHCTYNFQWGSAEYIRVGSIHLDHDKEKSIQSRRIIQRIRHPNFKKPSMYYDIALFKMIRPVTMNSYVRPACLPFKPNNEPNIMATITGWGLVNQTDNVGSAHLMKVDLPVVENETCQLHYAKIGSRFPNGFDSRTQLCAGGNGKDACPGDSGGGLVIQIETVKLYEVLGITSYGIGCGYDVPGIYTRVNYFLDWIENIVWPSSDSVETKSIVSAL